MAEPATTTPRSTTIEVGHLDAEPPTYETTSHKAPTPVVWPATAMLRAEPIEQARALPTGSQRSDKRSWGAAYDRPPISSRYCRTAPTPWAWSTTPGQGQLSEPALLQRPGPSECSAERPDIKGLNHAGMPVAPRRELAHGLLVHHGASLPFPGRCQPGGATRRRGRQPATVTEVGSWEWAVRGGHRARGRRGCTRSRGGLEDAAGHPGLRPSGIARVRRPRLRPRARGSRPVRDPVRTRNAYRTIPGDRLLARPRVGCRNGRHETQRVSRRSRTRW